MLYGTQKEFKERQKKLDIVWDLFEKNDYDAEKTCRECPFRKECKTSHLRYGCGIWEELMGEDL